MSDSDIFQFNSTLHDNLAESTTVPFNDKRYTFITDSTSNSGSFSGGMITFDLATLASQSQRLNLKEAVINFPINVYAKISTAGTGTETTKTIASIHSSIIKNGWHSFINGTQLVINGVSIQNNQNYENVSATFKILSEWSQDNLTKWGSSLGVALDDMTCDSEVATTLSTSASLANAQYSTVATSVRGFDCVNNQTYLFNKGVQTRANYMNNDINPSSATMQTSVLGSAGMINSATNNVCSNSSGSNTVGHVIYSARYMGSVKLSTLVDLSQFPMCKNVKGYLYIYTNAAEITLTGTAGSTAISSVDVNVFQGQTCPIMINTSSSGITMGQYATTAPVLKVYALVDGSSANTVTTATTNSSAVINSARLVVPFYTSNEDKLLSIPNKVFTNLEKIVNPFNISAGNSINYTITVGLPNPRKLLLLPLLCKLGGNTKLSNPETSCFDSQPHTSGPFASLSNLQINVANKPLFNSPIMYTFDQWNQENSDVGLNGNATVDCTSGLLSEQLFNQNHRFYYFDLSRRLKSEDGASKSISVSCTNPTKFDMKVIAIVYYQKQWVIDTDLCQILNVQ